MRTLLVAVVLGWLLAESAVAKEPIAGPVDTAPQVIHREPPEYPPALRMRRNRGQVLLEFIVNTEGQVRSPRVLESTHPEFEGAAVESLLKWKFKPAVKDGQLVSAWLQQRIGFAIAGAGSFGAGATSDGVDAFKVPARAPKNLPEPFRYDKPPRPILTSAPVYPRELLEKGVQGAAQVVFLIDPTGHTRDVVVREATHPKFGAATAAMIAAWEFEPAQKNGQPSWAMLSMRQKFNRNDRDSPVNASAMRLLNLLKKKPDAVLSDFNDLDEVPKPRYRAAPALPEAMRQAPTAETAEIDFIIDRSGRAQLAHVASASREDFGWAAATAIARWQFTPPQKDGKPVDVKARIPVVFNPEHAPKSLPLPESHSPDEGS